MTVQAFSLALRVIAVGIVGVALVHLVLGVSAEPLLGAQLPAAVQGDPALDSQNRFYGAAFALFAWVFWLAAEDPAGHRRLLAGALVVFFLGGCARIVSVVVIGIPPIPVLVLLGIELALPVVLWVWFRGIAES